MTQWIEQCYCIKFCQKLDDAQSETIKKIQKVYGSKAVDVKQIKDWYDHLKNGWMSVESDKHSGSPSTSRNLEVIEKLYILVMENCLVTIKETENELGIGYGSAQVILTKGLGMWLQQNLWQSFWHPSSKTSALMSLGTCWTVLIKIQTSCIEYSNWQWFLDVWIHPRNENSAITVVVTSITNHQGQRRYSKYEQG